MPEIKECIWRDYYGRFFYSVKQFEDSHLVNIIHHIKTYMPKSKWYTEKQLTTFMAEADRRGIKPEFHERAQIPHQSPHDGGWRLMDDHMKMIELREADTYE